MLGGAPVPLTDAVDRCILAGVLRDQSRHCGVVPSGLKPPIWLRAPQRAQARQAAGENFAQKKIDTEGHAIVLLRIEQSVADMPQDVGEALWAGISTRRKVSRQK